MMYSSKNMFSVCLFLAVVVVLLCLLVEPTIAESSSSSHRHHDEDDASSSSSINSRFHALHERAMNNPTIPEKFRGKTLSDFVVSNSNNNKHQQPQRRQQQKRRRQQNNKNRQAQEQGIDFQNAAASPSTNFYAVYEEFDPLPLKKLGETAGARGLVYDVAAKDEGIKDKFISGAFQATCSVVASTGIQLCTYEIFIVQGEFVGTLVATGSLTLELNKQNLLMVEATGDEYKSFTAGFVAITYLATGDDYVIDIEFLF
mmetsp:Transcript_35566/g.86080  ORF Transcript_35566/g.86080 Transcript_35566/m.86080 type:complete len:258 (-) Transcript_35566:503-1276(-)